MFLLSESLALLTSKIAFAIILAEEIIYDRLIKLASVDLISEANSINTQLTKIRVIIIKFRVALLEAQSKATQLEVLRSFESLES